MLSFFMADTDISIFYGLTISNEKELYEKYQGKFFVISIGLKDINGVTFEEFINMLKFMVFEEISCFD